MESIAACPVRFFDRFAEKRTSRFGRDAREPVTEDRVVEQLCRYDFFEHSGHLAHLIKGEGVGFPELNADWMESKQQQAGGFVWVS